MEQEAPNYLFSDTYTKKDTISDLHPLHRIHQTHVFPET